LSRRIRSHGARQLGERLVVPIQDTSGALLSLQTIGPDGDKRFLPGGRTRGGFQLIGTTFDVVLVCEGFATGAALHESTGHSVAVAFSSGNLDAVALAMRERFPAAEVVVCADDDAGTDGNPGVTMARKAAQSAGGTVAVPVFGAVRPEDATDFNDLRQLRGDAAVQSAVRQAREAHSWPDPDPLPGSLVAVAPFDATMLPEAVRSWVMDIGERLQCPIDFIAVPVMVALGSLIGRKIAIRPQARTDWSAYPNVWGCIVGRPGTMKSPAVSEALRPLRRLEARARMAYADSMRSFAAEAELAKLRLDAARADVRKKLASRKGADIELEELRVSAPDEPILRRYTANDSSLEALGELLRQNPNGLLIERDELASLLSHLSREENAGARGFFLTGADGMSEYTFDRIGRGLNLQVPAVCLSVLGTTQPGRIATYLRQALVGGDGDDGLMQRFGLLVWPDHGCEWRNVDRWPDSAARDRAFAAFDELEALTADEVGAEADGDLSFVRFTPDALECFTEWRTRLELKVRSGDLHPALESHFSKYRKTIPALALILHLADRGRGAVTHAATSKAIRWADYLESHAHRAYGAMRAGEVDAARKVLERIRRGDLADGFRARDITQRDWSGLAETSVVASALAILVDHGWLAETPTYTGTRGRPTVIYRAHPKAFGAL